MSAWEYMIERGTWPGVTMEFEPPQAEWLQQLNAAGARGWELVSERHKEVANLSTVLPGGDGGRVYREATFKRRREWAEQGTDRREVD